MSERRLSILAWVCFAVIISLVAWAVSRSPSYQACVATAPEYLRCLGVFADQNEGVITALATAAIALFTYTLWRSTHKLWVASERQMIISNRAWVFAQPWPGQTKFHPNGDIEIPIMEIAAQGNTPARVTELYVGFVAEARGTEPTFPKETIRENYNLAKGNRWGHRQKFITTTAEPVVYGFVRYTDAFGDKHESRYCYRLTNEVPEGFRTAGSAGWTRFD